MSLLGPSYQDERNWCCLSPVEAEKGGHVEPGPSCPGLIKEVSHLVVTAPGHDDVRVGLGGRDEHVEGRLDELRVLLDHALQVPAALRDVPLQTTTQPGWGTWWNLTRTFLYA